MTAVLCEEMVTIVPAPKLTVMCEAAPAGVPPSKTVTGRSERQACGSGRA